MAIVRLKTLKRNEKVNELLGRFYLPNADYSKGYQAKPRPEPVGASAAGGDFSKNITQLLRRCIVI